MSAGPAAGRGDAVAAPAVLTVVSGDASAEEVAALVAVLAAAAARRGSTLPAPEPSRWADRAALLRAPATPGPGAWQAAAWRR